MASHYKKEIGGQRRVDLLNFLKDVFEKDQLWGKMDLVLHLGATTEQFNDPRKYT